MLVLTLAGIAACRLRWSPRSWRHRTAPWRSQRACWCPMSLSVLIAPSTPPPNRSEEKHTSARHSVPQSLMPHAHTRVFVDRRCLFLVWQLPAWRHREGTRAKNGASTTVRTPLAVSGALRRRASHRSRGRVVSTLQGRAARAHWRVLIRASLPCGARHRKERTALGPTAAGCRSSRATAAPCSRRRTRLYEIRYSASFESTWPRSVNKAVRLLLISYQDYHMLFTSS